MKPHAFGAPYERRVNEGSVVVDPLSRAYLAVQRDAIDDLKRSRHTNDPKPDGRSRALHGDIHGGGTTVIDAVPAAEGACHVDRREPIRKDAVAGLGRSMYRQPTQLPH